MRCRSCREDNPDGTRFCGHCGAPLRTGATQPAAELRQLTVLFCDLVGSTSLAESLDPEDLREITGRYQSVCESVIRRHDGHIAQYLGDGVLVYFGYPVAHEDDTRRAVRAGLEIVGGLAVLTGALQEERDLELNVRVGIHTGPVVVGDVGAERREQLAIGKTPNLAARIQNIAAPGTVVVSDDTYRIVRGFFDFSPLGAHEIKGLSETVILHRVLQASGAETRMDVERRTGLTPLTGRDEELESLERRWSGLSSSGGHAVLLQGEAGIGKSRIVDSLRQHVERQSATVLECFCTPYAQNAPLFPIVALAERVLGFTRETTDTDKRAAINQRLALRGLLTEETSALMAGLLGIALTSGEPIANYSPQKQRERTLETLLAWLLAVARDRPTLWVVEDLHWVDPTTLLLLNSVLESLSEEPLLVILTFRPDFAAPWHISDRVSSVTLSRLAPGPTSSMALRVARGKEIPADVLNGIVARAEGVPLFVEEVTKAVLELGVLVEREDRFEISGPLPPDLIPTTVQGSLNARLDRLGRAKGIAQLASTIGREFSYALLRAVARESETELRQGLDRLTGAELVYRRENSPEETYLFKHALVRDAAYASLLRKSRRSIHERIAEVLTSHFPETARQHPELVAEHYSAAGRADQAVKSWLSAGRLAVGRAANHEAITHLNRGLALTAELPAADRQQQELELLIALIPALVASEGWASATLERVYRRAAELVELLGMTPHRFTVLAGTMGYHFVAGRVAESLELAKQLLELSARISDPLLLTVARQNCSATHCYHGAFRLAVEHGEAGLAMLDPGRERLIGQTFGVSSAVGILTYEYIAFWMLGFPARSLQTSERCLAFARELDHAPSIGFALTARAGMSYLRGEAKDTLAFAEEALRFAHEERLGFFEPIITVYRGWALSELGEPAEGLRQIRGAIERYHSAGNGVQQVWLHATLASVQSKTGEWDRAFATLARAMTLATRNGEGLFEPELYRLRGEFLFAQAMGTVGTSASAAGGSRETALADAECSIRESIELARRQEAKALELRSLVSLCRVRRELGAVSQERDTLAEIYGLFTEGVETPDLSDARLMLEALRE